MLIGLGGLGASLRRARARYAAASWTGPSSNYDCAAPAKFISRRDWYRGVVARPAWV